MKHRVLVVDDEPVIHDIVRECLGPEYSIFGAFSVEEGAAALQEEVPDVLLVDMRLPGGSGLDLAKRALQMYPDLATIVLTGHGALEDFLAAFRAGVADYVLKPFTPTTLRQAVRRGLETRRLRAENARLRREVAGVGDPSRILLGSSPPIVALRELLASVAPTDTTVLLTGASGTGKELAARSLHAQSRRSSGPFVAVHCGALSESLLEAELFGHVRGAFTGADRHRAGRFEEAHGGTLFLDEVATMAPATQVKLLRVLATGEIRRVGADVPHVVDVRIIAASNEDLGGLVETGRFRADLHYRLNVFPIAMPTLASRAADIPELAQHFLDASAARLGRATPPMLSQRAVRSLLAHAWPGNVRELENAMERAAILTPPGGTVEPSALLPPPRPGTRGACRIPDEGLDLPAYLEAIENDLIRQAMERARGNRQRAAALLRLHRSTLSQKLRRQDRQSSASPPSFG